MRTVEDGSGRRYLLLKRSGDASLVQDLETGEQSYVPNASLCVVDGSDTLGDAGRSAPDELRRTVPDDRTAGLLVLLAGRDRTSVRTVLDNTDLCESDLFASIGELQAAGFVERIAGEDGETAYAITEEGVALLDRSSQS